MPSLVNSLSKAADEAERLARALGNAGGSGVKYDPKGPPVTITNNIQINGPSAGGGDGLDTKSRAFAYFGISPRNKSDLFVRQLIAEFERLLGKSGIQHRASGGS